MWHHVTKLRKLNFARTISVILNQKHVNLQAVTKNGALFWMNDDHNITLHHIFGVIDIYLFNMLCSGVIEHLLAQMIIITLLTSCCSSGVKLSLYLYNNSSKQWIINGLLMSQCRNVRRIRDDMTTWFCRIESHHPHSPAQFSSADIVIIITITFSGGKAFIYIVI